MNVEFEKIYWHDGTLEFINISVKENGVSVTAKFKVYMDESSSSRSELTVLFEDIFSHQFTIDAAELISNCNAGNIIDAFLKQRSDSTSQYIYRFLFLDGYLEIISGNAAQVSKSLNPKSTDQLGRAK